MVTLQDKINEFKINNGIILNVQVLILKFVAAKHYTVFSISGFGQK